MTTESWNPQPGEPVVIFSSPYGRYNSTAVHATVQRLTKTMLILDNGYRYKLRDICTGTGCLHGDPVGYASNGWAATDTVYPADHPALPKRLSHIRREQAISSARTLARNLPGVLAEGEPVEVIRDAAARLTELAAILDETDPP